MDALHANLLHYRAVHRSIGAPAAASIVFAPNVDHRQLLAWSVLLYRWRSTGTHVVLFLRYGTHRSGSWQRLWKRLMALSLRPLELRSIRQRLTLATDSTKLADEYRRLTTIPVQVWPIPHTADVIASDLAAQGMQRRATVLTWLSDPRDERGFPLFVAAIEWLISTDQLEGLQFIVQRSGDRTESGDSMQALRRLDRLGLRVVTFSNGPLPRAEYVRVLQASDVIVLPYDAEVYAARTSGPFTEALASGKAVIVSSGTWMSDQLQRHGAGIAFRQGDARDLASAMLEAHLRRDELLARADRARTSWLGQHNPKGFVDLLLATSPSLTNAPERNRHLAGPA
jgi:glycosyltransferase involved in cell wall biosynthesis